MTTRLDPAASFLNWPSNGYLPNYHPFPTAPPDHNRARKDHAAHNLAILHHIALNLLKQESSLKVGIKAKRLRAGWDHRYLLKVLSGA